MEKAKKLKKNNSIEESFKIKENNRQLTTLLQNKTGKFQLEDYPQEVDYYFLSKKNREEAIAKELESVEEKLKRVTNNPEKLEKRLARKSQLTVRLEELTKE